MPGSTKGHDYMNAMDSPDANRTVPKPVRFVHEDEGFPDPGANARIPRGADRNRPGPGEGLRRDSPVRRSPKNKGGEGLRRDRPGASLSEEQGRRGRQKEKRASQPAVKPARSKSKRRRQDEERPSPRRLKPTRRGAGRTRQDARNNQDSNDTDHTELDFEPGPKPPRKSATSQNV
ncbi:hypothetical protein P43SY_010707 [Pythium insidiosum]|uniref:Uncharacterized protein n=1 Tax=Pythium insidiosum TaxID=114742 RepID=A0AAD5Q3M9_PYTIN|nr:hypothetical protein P43SY_010707 [Pythium insidiosum]